MRYLVRIYRHKSGYNALAPDLPGCVATDDSVEKVRKLMAEAMKMHIELMQESGEKVPRPRRHTAGEDGEDFCTWIEVKLEQPRRKLVRSR